MIFKTLFLILIVLITQSYSQVDAVKSQWPVTPFNTSQNINANFGEFRNTLSSDHFHNAVDVGKADGQPCYSGLDGKVSVIVNSGSNSYVGVLTQIDSKWKRFTYLHIEPNPSLEIGDPVQKGVTILGTISDGMGHVHLIERELVSSESTYGAEINSLRANGGLTPYNDNYPPVINRNSLKFFIDGTSTQLPAYGLTGKVDIQVKIEEHNGTSGSQTNNGTYIAGYRIWSHDTTQIVQEPNDAGIKYRFDVLPSNSYVHRVFVEDLATLSNPVYWLTNGSGESAINQTHQVTNNYFNTVNLDTGAYVLEIFTEDTRGNKDLEFFSISITDQDLSAPKTPVVMSLINSNSNKSVNISWKKNIESDLAGYRLYYSSDNQLSGWELAADESRLTKEIKTFYIESPYEFVIPPTQDVWYFRFTAVDTNGNESAADDIYARSSYSDGQAYTKALIVNGFTRFGGSGSRDKPTHSFVKSYFEPLNSVDSIVVSSCNNEAIIANEILLNDYNFVIWFLGDESTVDHTFTSTEQGKIKDYLENGGRVFVSGSEVGWDLGRSHTNSESGDEAFYNNYLKATYINDGNSNMSPAKGINSSTFAGVQLNFGQVYPEDYPDDIDAVNGSEIILYYDQIRSGTTHRKAGVAYTGSFGQSHQTGQIVYISFPLETVSSLDQRSGFMSSLLQYYNIVTDIGDKPESYPQRLSLSQNYPNPFNPETQFRINVPQSQNIEIKIFDLLGREIKVIADKKYLAGEYTFSWNGNGHASGFYLIEMRAGKTRITRKVLLLK